MLHMHRTKLTVSGVTNVDQRSAHKRKHNLFKNSRGLHGALRLGNPLGNI